MAKIKVLTQQDINVAAINGVATIERLVHPEDSWTAQAITELLQQDMHHCWVMVDESVDTAEQNDSAHVVAYCLFSTVFEVAEIFRIGTHPNHQRQGLAQQLLAQLIAHMPDKQLERILLEVRSDNQPAIALYQKIGFTTMHTRKAYYSNPVSDALIMAYQNTAYD